LLRVRLDQVSRVKRDSYVIDTSCNFFVGLIDPVVSYCPRQIQAFCQTNQAHQRIVLILLLATSALLLLVSVELLAHSVVIRHFVFEICRREHSRCSSRRRLRALCGSVAVDLFTAADTAT